MNIVRVGGANNFAYVVERNKSSGNFTGGGGHRLCDYTHRIEAAEAPLRKNMFRLSEAACCEIQHGAYCENICCERKCYKVIAVKVIATKIIIARSSLRSSCCGENVVELVQH